MGKKAEIAAQSGYPYHTAQDDAADCTADGVQYMLTISGRKKKNMLFQRGLLNRSSFILLLFCNFCCFVPIKGCHFIFP